MRRKCLEDTFGRRGGLLQIRVDTAQFRAGPCIRNSVVMKATNSPSSADSLRSPDSVEGEHQGHSSNELHERWKERQHTGRSHARPVEPMRCLMELCRLPLFRRRMP